jgi:hypothetical protein
VLRSSGFLGEAFSEIFTIFCLTPIYGSRNVTTSHRILKSAKKLHRMEAGGDDHHEHVVRIGSLTRDESCHLPII